MIELWVKSITLEDYKMDKYIYDKKNGLWYELQGDYYLPCLKLPEEEGVTETLKADEPMEWVGRMNNIRNRATEIVNAEMIYA